MTVLIPDDWVKKWAENIARLNEMGTPQEIGYVPFIEYEFRLANFKKEGSKLIATTMDEEVYEVPFENYIRAELTYKLEFRGQVETGTVLIYEMAILKDLRLCLYNIQFMGQFIHSLSDKAKMVMGEVGESYEEEKQGEDYE